MNREDLIDGEIYSCINSYNETCVFEYNSKNNGKRNSQSIGHNCFVGMPRNYFMTDDHHYVFRDIEKATPEQKHWLLECEKNNKFISYDEAIKTFVKEFVLPEFWWVQPTNSYELEQVKLFFKDKLVSDVYSNNELKIGQTFGYISSWGGGYYYNLIASTLNNCLKLTFEQFQQYVLKQPKLNYTILQQDSDKITQIANEEGNIFMIGDRIKSIKRTLPSTIIEFKLGQTNNMLAITSQYSKNGISIDKIEHYIEPVKVVEEFKLSVDYTNESLLDKAKRLYPVGTKFISLNITDKGRIRLVKPYHEETLDIEYTLQTNGNVYCNSGMYNKKEYFGTCSNPSVYMNGKWAEIIK